MVDSSVADAYRTRDRVARHPAFDSIPDVVETMEDEIVDDRLKGNEVQRY